MKDSITKIEEALEYIPSDDREIWVQVGMALHHEYNGSEDGFQLWDVWSAKSDKYNAQDMHSQWKSFANGSGITIGTLLHHAKQNGYQPNAPINSRAMRCPKKPTRHHTATPYNELDSVGTEDYIDDMPPDLSIDEIKQHVFSKVNLDEGYVLTAIYRYTNQENKLLYFRLRVDHPESGDKKILPVSYDVKKNTWVKKEPAFIGLKPLYNLHSLSSVPTDEIILFVEGEKCVDIATKLGVTALSSGGATSANKADFSPLQKQTIWLWPDNDRSGIKFMHTVIEKLIACGCQNIRIINIDALNLGESDDLSEWLDQHPDATKKDLFALDTLEIPSDGWEPMQPLHDESCMPQAPYPIEAFPDVMKDAILAVHESAQAPLPMIAASALSALSLAAQAHIDIERTAGLKGPVSLYCLTVCDSGERKTTCDSLFMEPLRKYEQEQRVAQESSYQTYKADHLYWEEQLSGLKAKIRRESKSNKSNNHNSQSDLKAQLHELQKEEPSPPKIPKLCYTDATTEALGYGLSKRWPSAGAMTSEGGQFFGAHSFGKDHRVSALSLYNVLWDGGASSVDRKTMDSYEICNARLSVSILVQPAVIDSFMQQSQGLARGSGFLARFLFCRPQSTQGRRFFKEMTGLPKLETFHSKIRRMLARDLPLDDTGNLAPRTLRFTREGKKAWVICHDKIERELTPEGDLFEVRDVASKAADNIARLATLFQVLLTPEYLDGEAPDEGRVVTEDNVNQAAAIVNWHLEQSLAFYIKTDAATDIQDALLLSQWLLRYSEKHNLQTIKHREILKNGPPRLRKKKALDAALVTLADAHHIRTLPGSSDIILHPNFYKEFQL